MGVWARGPRPDRMDIPGIAEAMRPAVEAFMTARLRIYDPKRLTASGYDPINDSGGFPATALVLDTGSNGALIQPIRSPTRIDVGGQPNGIVGIRFQVKVDPAPAVPLRNGLMVQVLEPGNSTIPLTWRFSLSEGVDTSLMWDRILDATLVTGGV